MGNKDEEEKENGGEEQAEEEEEKKTDRHGCGGTDKRKEQSPTVPSQVHVTHIHNILFSTVL